MKITFLILSFVAVLDHHRVHGVEKSDVKSSQSKNSKHELRALSRIVPEDAAPNDGQSVPLTEDQLQALRSMGYNRADCGMTGDQLKKHLQKRASMESRKRRSVAKETKSDTTDSEPYSSETTEEIKPTIVNGQLAEPGQFPYQVSLQSEDGEHVCGAAIISECHVATAAHCVSDSKGRLTEKSKHMKVIYGSTDNKKGQTVRVEKRMKHAYFSNIPYDIAVMKVDKCFGLGKNLEVHSVCMPTADRATRFNEDDRATVSGWGVVDPKTGKSSNKLHYLNLQMIPTEQCETEMESEFYDRTTMLCQEKSSTGCCFGDSGGPLVWHDPKDNRKVLIGEVRVTFDLNRYLSVINYHP